MEDLKADNERIIREAKIERDAILKEAREIKDRIVGEAKDVAKAEGDKLIEAAKQTINAEKKCCHGRHQNSDRCFICKHCRIYLETKVR